MQDLPALRLPYFATDSKLIIFSTTALSSKCLQPAPSSYPAALPTETVRQRGLRFSVAAYRGPRSAINLTSPPFCLPISWTLTPRPKRGLHPQQEGPIQIKLAQPALFATTLQPTSIPTCFFCDFTPNPSLFADIQPNRVLVAHTRTSPSCPHTTARPPWRRPRRPPRRSRLLPFPTALPNTFLSVKPTTTPRSRTFPSCP